MKRDRYLDLVNWKNSKNRKPLLLQGARQVGKTYLVQQFANDEYSEFIYLNFEQTPGLSTLFDSTLNAQVILENLGLYIGKKIAIENSLIFFDEVQVCPMAITSLKYFYEQLPNIHIIAAGSLLGVAVSNGTSFPVGKINFLTLYPMTFMEFLRSNGEELLVEKLNSITKIDPLEELIHNKLINLYKLYLYIGGMPEVVKDYRDNRDIESVRAIQNDILSAYERDFSKYTSSTQTIKTKELWNSIPYQLGKENKKFKYSDVKKSGRASAYETTIEWLKSAGLINIAYNISIPNLPLSGYCNREKFKIYLLDSGLLGAMLNLTSDAIILQDKIFKEYNGAFVENYTAQEITANSDKDLYYWTSKSEAKVDFILEIGDKIYPLEVKSGTSRNLKSLNSYKDKYKPQFTFRTSPRNFIQTEDFANIPLYAVNIMLDKDRFKKLFYHNK